MPHSRHIGRYKSRAFGQIHPEIKCKKPHSRCKLESACGLLHAISERSGDVTVIYLGQFPMFSLVYNRSSRCEIAGDDPIGVIFASMTTPATLFRRRFEKSIPRPAHRRLPSGC
eukprot:2457978-Rhodomonas_salina.6